MAWVRGEHHDDLNPVWPILASRHGAFIAVQKHLVPQLRLRYRSEAVESKISLPPSSYEPGLGYILENPATIVVAPAKKLM